MFFFFSLVRAGRGRGSRGLLERARLPYTEQTNAFPLLIDKQQACGVGKDLLPCDVLVDV